MLRLLLLGLLAVTLTACVEGTDCEDTTSAVTTFTDRIEDDCENMADGMYPSANSCGYHVHCVLGQAHILHCGPGTSYDPEQAVCVLEANYECPV